MSETITLVLPDGASVRAEVSVTGEEQVAFRETFDFETITKTVRGIAGSIRGGLESLMPDKVSVEFGLELAIENGVLAAIVAKGSTKANFTIALEWTRDKPPDEKSK